VALMQLADPIGRLWYWWITGTTVQWVPEVGRTIIVFMIATTSTLGAVTAATLFLTFFPTAAYKRWLRTPSQDNRSLGVTSRVRLG